MKNLIVNKGQFESLAEFNINHNTFMKKLTSSEMLNESKLDINTFYGNFARELKESTNGIGLGYSLLEGALALGIPSKNMIALAEELGVPPKTKKNMVMGYYQKLERTDKYLDEQLLQEGLFEYLSKLLKGRTGETLKKTIINLVIAGKLAMVSTSALAGAASQIDSSIDAEQFKTELESVKSQKGSLTPEQKKAQLGILSTSTIQTQDGKTLKFNYIGSFDSFSEVNSDNYPQFHEGTPEKANLDAAFAKADATGEGIVTGKCNFKKGGQSVVFDGQFVQANGLWYKYVVKSAGNPSDITLPPTKTPDPNPVPTPKTDQSDTFTPDGQGHQSYQDYTPIFSDAKKKYDYLKSQRKPVGDFSKFLIDRLKEADKRFTDMSDQEIMNMFSKGTKIDWQTR